MASAADADPKRKGLRSEEAPQAGSSGGSGAMSAAVGGWCSLTAARCCDSLTATRLL